MQCHIAVIACATTVVKVLYDVSSGTTVIPALAMLLLLLRVGPW
jgi:hypothetical protein